MEDEEKQEKADSEAIVKTLNSTMLRILENSNLNDIFCVLFDLLINYRRKHMYAKILGLIIKCILKLTKSLDLSVSTLQPSKLLLKSHVYLAEFTTDPSKISEDMGIKTIKTILNELVKIYQDKIWEHYKILQGHNVPDVYIHRWISVILKPIANQAPRLFKVVNQMPVDGNYNTNQNNQIQNNNQQNDEIPRIRAIIEAIKMNPNDVDLGIRQLYDEIIKNPGTPCVGKS